MAGKVRHLINRSGRYHARLVVPKDLRDVVGKTELRSPLGADYRQALKLLPGAVARLQHQIAQAERKAGQGHAQAGAARYPLAPDQLALSHYNQRLAFDDLLRNEPGYADSCIDDLYVSRLRKAVAGRSNDDELHALIGDQLERFRAIGNISAGQGSDEWRVIARALCSAELEALARVAERDEGDYTGTPTAPIIVNAQPPADVPEPVSLKGLWADYVNARKQAGFMRDGGCQLGLAVERLRKFVKHDDAARLMRKDIIDWRDHLLIELSAKTVSDKYLSTIRSLLNWAVENERLAQNVAATVKQPKKRRTLGREKGFTNDEATKLLTASRAYLPHEDARGRVREKPELVAAKQWVPILAAFSGARVTELTQLRKEDLRRESGQWVMRITPISGSVKSDEYRDVPLHRQIIAEGFERFLEAAKDGPLFHGGTDPEKYQTKAVRISSQLAEWLRKSGLVPEKVQPNHAWRHRLKTQFMELGIGYRFADAIQGHSGKNSSDGYGDITITMRADAIAKLPEYLLD